VDLLVWKFNFSEDQLPVVSLWTSIKINSVIKQDRRLKSGVVTVMINWVPDVEQINLFLALVQTNGDSVSSTVTLKINKGNWHVKCNFSCKKAT
jgi:hypothetical protein